MAVFEKKKEDKIIDDSMLLLGEITDTINTKGYVEYKIRVHRLPDVKKTWCVLHRYSQFRDLHSALKSPTVELPPLPPKKYFGNQTKEFITERKCLLQEYLDALLKMPYISTSPHMKRFLDPLNSSGNFLEEAHEHLLESLRAGGRHVVAQTISCMGTRLRKHFFIGHPLNDPRTAHSFWFAQFGPDKVLSIKDIHTALSALVQCHHPHIVTPISCVASDAGACAIRPWFRQGSLRDYIYCVKPQFHFLLKYTNDRKRNMPMKTCAVYGRQILEALKFLHEKSIGHGSLHTGNVVIQNNVCQLMDLENQILGLPHRLRPYFIVLKKINSIEAIDVYSFGHLLYEMVFNEPLNSEMCTALPENLDPLCRSVLESILSAEACKNGLPSVADLLTHPFFNEVPLHSFEKPVFKLSAAAKLAFQATYDRILTRLKDDQRKMKLLRQKSRGEEAVAQLSKSKSKSRPKEQNDGRESSHSAETNSVTNQPGSENLQKSETGENESNQEVQNLEENAASDSHSQNIEEEGDSTPQGSRDALFSSIVNFKRSNLKASQQ